jgi:hypothetical protein
MSVIPYHAWLTNVNSFQAQKRKEQITGILYVSLQFFYMTILTVYMCTLIPPSLLVLLIEEW